MKCPNCGTDNNFEWASFCRGCLQPLAPSGDPDEAGQLPQANATTAIPIQAEDPPQPRPVEEDDKLEIGVSDPMDYIMGSSPISGAQDIDPRERVKPEPIENELTLYQAPDSNQTAPESKPPQWTPAEPLRSKSGPAVAVIEKPSQTQAQEVPAETTVEQPSNDEQQPDGYSLEPGSTHDKDQLVTAYRIDPTQVAETEKAHSHSFENIAPVGQVKHSKGVAYVSGNNLRFTGGYRATPGDEIIADNKVFEVKAQPKKNPTFYIAIGAGVIVLVLVVLAVGSMFGQEKGQLVGTISNPDGILLSGKTVRLVELDKTASTSQAGFFVFDQIPSGIYTLEYQNQDNTWAKDRVTVIKSKTSTIALKESKPEASIPQLPASTSKPSDQSKAESGAKAGRGSLKLVLDPPTSAAYLNTKALGVGSNTYNIAPGEYTLTIKKPGYQDNTQQITVESNKTVSLKINLAAQPPGTSKTDSQLAYESETAGNYREADKYYARVLAKSPRDVSALLGRARCARADGRGDDAVTLYMQATKVASDKGDTKSQVEALTGVIEMKPNTYTAYASRGDILYSMGQYDRAINDFSKVIELDSRNLSVYYKLGNSFYKSKKYSEALKSYLAAQELNFADPKAEAYLAKTYLALGDKKNCKKAYERFAELSSYSARLEFKKDAEWQKVLDALGVKE